MNLDELNSSVALAVHIVIVGSERLVGTETTRRESFAEEALSDKIIHHRFSPPDREFQIRIMFARVVGVSINFKSQVGILFEEHNGFIKDARGLRGDLGASCREHNVIDEEISPSISGEWWRSWRR